MANQRKKVSSKGKVKRVPFAGNRKRLHVEETFPGYVPYWFNDQDGNLERAEAAGYVYVTRDEVPSLGQGQLHQENTDLNSKVSKVVSRGEPVIRAYLMKIKKSWYEQDKQLKEEKNERVDEALRQGTPSGNIVDNQYVPKGHVQSV